MLRMSVGFSYTNTKRLDPDFRYWRGDQTFTAAGPLLAEPRCHLDFFRQGLRRTCAQSNFDVGDPGRPARTGSAFRGGGRDLQADALMVSPAAGRPEW